MDRIQGKLRGHSIDLDEREDANRIFDHVDAFENLSRKNETVYRVTLWIPFIDPGDDDASGTHDRYAKIAEGIANLQALTEILIETRLRDEDDEEEAFVPDWTILACILRRLRRGIELRMCNSALLGDAEFAGVIHGQAMITGFETGPGFHFHCFEILCSALLTLPALESVSFNQQIGQAPEEGQSLESMVKLFQSPVLRKVSFGSVDFTNTLSQAIAKALEERSEIASLVFWKTCSFPEGGKAVIARALETNTTLESLYFFNDMIYEGFYDALAAALLLNSTLQVLTLGPTPGGTDGCSFPSPLFLALQENNGLKELTFLKFHIDEELSTAMMLGLGKNSTLEKLELRGIKSAGDDTLLWMKALSFLSTNTALKTLHMSFDENYVMESHSIALRMEVAAASAIRMEVAAALSKNKSLETLDFMLPYKETGFKDFLVFLVAIQPNITLKRLPWSEHGFCLDEDETERLILVLKKNYGLEEISGLRHAAGDIRSIFQLNRAGRRYLVQDGSSISKGVDVLIGVSNDINSVFLHLLENPRLCDRSAVEMSRTSNLDNTRSTSLRHHSGESDGGKREQEAPSHTGKESRRRLE
jgi:hypothetical protein